MQRFTHKKGTFTIDIPAIAKGFKRDCMPALIKKFDDDLSEALQFSYGLLLGSLKGNIKQTPDSAQWCLALSDQATKEEIRDLIFSDLLAFYDWNELKMTVILYPEFIPFMTMAQLVKLEACNPEAVRAHFDTVQAGEAIIRLY